MEKQYLGIHSKMLRFPPLSKLYQHIANLLPTIALQMQAGAEIGTTAGALLNSIITISETSEAGVAGSGLREGECRRCSHHMSARLAVLTPHRKKEVEDEDTTQGRYRSTFVRVFYSV